MTATLSRRMTLRHLLSAPIAAAGTANLLVIDPIFAAINRHRGMVAAIDAMPDDEHAVDSASRAEGQYLRDLARTAPVTSAGLSALLAYVAEREGLYIDDESPLFTVCQTAARALTTI